MRITNLSKVDIICNIDDRRLCINSGLSFECNDNFDLLMVSSNEKSYSIIEASKSMFLKILSFWDDPFKLIKEYHLVVNSLFPYESICNSQQLNITVETCYVETDTRTYYDFIRLEADGEKIRPKEVKIMAEDEIGKDFIINNTKLAKWQTIWDVIVEPIILEAIGYFAVYRIFSIWFGERAWSIVLFLFVPNVLLELLMLVIKKRKYRKRITKFKKHFSSEVIYDCCYNTEK